jgi:hypothetical protein
VLKGGEISEALVVLPDPCASLLLRKNWVASLLLKVAPDWVKGLGRNVQAAFAGVPPVLWLSVVHPWTPLLKLLLINVVGVGAERSTVFPGQTAAALDVAVITGGGTTETATVDGAEGQPLGPLRAITW